MSDRMDERLDAIISVYVKEYDAEKDLMAEPVYLEAFNMAALFLDIQKEFQIDLNQLIPKLNLFTRNEILAQIKLICG